MKKFLLVIAFALAHFFAAAQCSLTLIGAINVSCYGMCNGSASVAANGVPPFTIQWSNNDTGSTVHNLCPGVHTAVLLDATGCSAVITVNITEPPPLVSQGFVTYLNCSCQVMSTVSGGTPPYAYMWCDGSTGTTTNICVPGLCMLTVVDGNGCIVTDTILIAPPPPLVISATVVDASCAACNDGMVILTPSGGLMPYQLYFNGVAVANDTVTNLAPGTYLACVIDEWSCQYCDSVVVSYATGIESSSKYRSPFRVSPNPSNGKLWIQGPDFPEPVHIVFYNVMGEKVLEQSLKKDGELQKAELNFSTGIYGYSIFSGNKRLQTGNVVVQ